ncbi:MAG TPA: nucleotidyltransferase domain-containing protein [Steroidobacteraceae bacterium]|nr:nucleotidyltransferase domain-containing protein [Steroidobacteraceae bacterium]
MIEYTHGGRTYYASRLAPPQAITILQGIVGSTVHGTNLAGSDDTDEMGIVIEPREYVIGLKDWESSTIRTQPDGVSSGPGDVDLSVHSLRKFARLAAGGNPSILIPLFIPKEFIRIETDIGTELRQHREMFLSQVCGQAFLGYLHSQRKRMCGESGGRHGRPRQELIDQHGFDTKYGGHIIRLGLQGIELMTEGVLTLPMRRRDREEVLAVRMGKTPAEEVLQRAEALEQHLHSLMEHKKSPLPEKPQWDRINDFLSKMYTLAWHRQEAADAMHERQARAANEA